jgi:hypothetical protein
MTFTPAPPLRPAGTLITPGSMESLEVAFKGMVVGNPGSTAHPAANLAIYVPFVLAAPANIQSVMWNNGATVGGNIDVGVYDEAGARLVSLGSTARGTVSTVITTTTLTDTVVGAGRYYMAFLCDSTANIIAWVPAAGICEALGVLEQAVGAATLPNPATFAVTTRAYIPQFGIYAQTIAL